MGDWEDEVVACMNYENVCRARDYLHRILLFALIIFLLVSNDFVKFFIASSFESRSLYLYQWTVCPKFLTEHIRMCQILQFNRIPKQKCNHNHHYCLNQDIKTIVSEAVQSWQHCNTQIRYHRIENKSILKTSFPHANTFVRSVDVVVLIMKQYYPHPSSIARPTRHFSRTILFENKESRYDEQDTNNDVSYDSIDKPNTATHISTKSNAIPISHLANGRSECSLSRFVSS